MSNAEQPVEFKPVVEHAAAIEETVGRFIRRAVELHASDLFFAPAENSYSISVRQLGLIRELERISLDEGHRCVNHIKAVAELNLTERRHPQDGRWILRTGGQRVDMRISTLPTMHGEDLTIRLLDHDTSLRTLDNLGLLEVQKSAIRTMLSREGGLVLVTGPNGSGKTTTLYACLHYLNDGTRKINTIEDPVEYAIAGLRQSQTNTTINLDFPDLLRSVLRQSPDVIMIGEIRDSITAQTAIRAANSGHLVLATLHAPVAAAAIESMLNLHVHPHFLSTSLRGVITERLVRVLCPKCKVEIDWHDAPATFTDVQPWIEPGQGERIFAPQGCDQCWRTGYNDRVGVFEILNVTTPIRKLIARSAPARTIEQEAINQGMIEFRRSGTVKVAQGQTSIEELVRVVPIEYLGLDS